MAREVTSKKPEGNFLVKEMFHIFVMVGGYTNVYVFLNSRAVYLKDDFTMCKLYLNTPDFKTK